MNDYELYHHGILGMKWGVRRYQNADGSLTAAGRRRYGVTHNPDGSMKTNLKSDSETTRKVKKDYNTLTDAEFKAKYSGSKAVYNKRVKKYGDPYMKSPMAKAGKGLEKASGKKLNNLSPEQKKKLLTIAATTAAIGAIGGLSYVAIKQKKQLISTGKKYAELHAMNEDLRKLSYNAYADRDKYLSLLKDSNLNFTVKGVDPRMRLWRDAPSWWYPPKH